MSPFVDKVKGGYRAGPFREESAMPEYLLAVHIVEGQEPPAEEIEQM